ncbi:MAG: sigma-70 family RNA polymerase sigma factor [Muribaculaceae bacterium]|nr:sigma-70 family RNA polymerase sigma factor [Muribaculaceae bacterium]
MGTELLTDAFCRLQNKLHFVASRLLNDDAEASDAVQDAFCNLLEARSPDSYDEARYRLFAVLKNVCINKLRRRRPITGVETPEIAEEPVYAPDGDSLRRELMATLTPVQRQVFCLAVDQELEYSEIAEQLGMSIDAVRMHMCRARKILRFHYKKLEL